MASVQKLDFSTLETVDVARPDVSKDGVAKARRKKRTKKKKNDAQTKAAEEKKAKEAKYTRGEGNSLKGHTSAKLRSKLRETEAFAKQSVEESARAEVLLPSEAGFLEPEGDVEQTWRFHQKDLKELVDVRTQRKMMELDLEHFGPYSMDFTRNGRHMLLGGRKGHVAMMDRASLKLHTEIHLRETIRDVCFLHDQTMFAVAQKKYVFVYDNTGTELHRLKNHTDVNKLGFLPYHFLLASVGKTGFLKYIDTSTGQNVSEHRTRLGECKVLRPNPSNAIICLGHSHGSVTMWSPNMSTPLVKMLCHRAPVLDLCVDTGGYDMVTSGLDGQVKVWDVRTYKEKHSYFTSRPATSVDISDMGLLSLGFGSQVQIWKDALASKQSAPYMREQLTSPLHTLRFVPYEDLLAATTTKGFSSLVVPGAGEPNFDSFEANPFQTKKQRRESTVVSLLEKLQPSMITLDPNMFGLMDKSSKTLLDGERRALREEKAKEALNMDKMKQRGRSRSSKRWKRKRKNIVDHEFEQRKEKIKKLHHLREQDKKDRDRKKEGKAKDTLDRFKRVPK